jgi:hypothetical protein
VNEINDSAILAALRRQMATAVARQTAAACNAQHHEARSGDLDRATPATLAATPLRDLRTTGAAA